MEELLVNDKLQLAGLYFKSKNYGQALKLYDDLVQRLFRYTPSQIRQVRSEQFKLHPEPLMGPLIHPKLPIVLDQRAATHEKLASIENAFKDGKKLVKLDPLGCKGYLRVGKLLLKMNRPLDAYKNYQKGIYTIRQARQKHSIEVPPKLWENLKSQHAMLNLQLKAEKEGLTTTENVKIAPSKRPSSSPTSSFASSFSSTSSSSKKLKLSQNSNTNTSTNTDFVQLFPPEILALVFSLLPLKQVLRCHLVCRDWYSALTHIPELYMQKVHFKSQLLFPEFEQGFKLIRRVAARSSSKRIGSLKLRSCCSSSHFSKILESILTKRGVSVKSLDIVSKDMSVELLVNKLAGTGWRCPNVEDSSVLRLGINSPNHKFENLLLNFFKQLTSLEILALDNVLRSVNAYMVPLDGRTVELCLKACGTYESLKTLALVNHPKSDLTVPNFIEVAFPNLQTLTIVSYDFKNKTPVFGEFLSKCSCLESVYLENNKGLDISSFLTLLNNYQPSFRLRKLLFREVTTSRSLVENHTPEDLLCLSSLMSLDIYCCSLSNRSLKQLLRICNYNSNLKTVAIGNSKYISFKNDRFSLQPKMYLRDILEIVPGIERLFLNELELDNLSMKLFYNDIVAMGISKCKLTHLDLSFCTSIDGTGLMNLFQISLSKNLNINEEFHLDELVLDGIDLNKNSLAMLTRKGYVKRVKNDPFKAKWKQYGVNTLVNL